LARLDFSIFSFFVNEFAVSLLREPECLRHKVNFTEKFIRVTVGSVPEE